MKHFDQVDDSLARKMIALLAKAKDGAATTHEAEAAMAKVQELAIKHQIDLSTVTTRDSANGRGAFSSGTLQVGKGCRRPPQHKYVACIITSFFNVEIVRGTGKYSATITFLGRSQEVAFAQYAYGYLHKTFERLWRSYKQEHGSPMAYRGSFYYGLYVGLFSKLEAGKTQVEKVLLEQLAESSGSAVEVISNTYAISVLGEKDLRAQFIKGLHPVLTKGRSTGNEIKNYGAFCEGKERGKDITIAPGLEAGKENGN